MRGFHARPALDIHLIGGYYSYTDWRVCKSNEDDVAAEAIAGTEEHMSVSATETYEFTVSGTPRIVVRNRAGGIRFEPGAAGQIHVTVTKRARNGLLGSASAADFERVEVHATRNGDTIRIEAEHNRNFGIGKQYTVDIEISAPATADLDLRMNAGNVEVRGVSGTIEGVVNAGNFDIAGSTLSGRSAFTVNAGNLTLEGGIAQGAALDAEVNAGNMRLHLPQDTPAYLDAKTDVGSIHVDGWPVNFSRQLVRQEATGRLGAEPQGTLRLRVNTGNITLRAR